MGGAVPQRVSGGKWGAARGGGVRVPSRRRGSAAVKALAAPHECGNPLGACAPDCLAGSGGPDAAGLRA